MKDSDRKNNPLQESPLRKLFPSIAFASACVLFGALMALGIRALWELDSMPVTNNYQEQLMHRKTRTMEQIFDGLVRGNMRRVEDAAEHMQKIGRSIDWYLSSSLYEDNDEIFRDATSALIDAARKDDQAAAKEFALQLERSCIDCHALINREQRATP